MGRKKLDKKKSESIQISIKPDDKQAFDAWCMENSTTMSEVVRQSIAPYISLGYKIVESQKTSG